MGCDLLIDKKQLESIKNFLAENYDCENHTEFGKNGKFSKILDRLKIVAKKFLKIKHSNKLSDLYGKSYFYIDSKRDLIIAYFIKNKIENAPLLNEILRYFNLRDLSGHKNLSAEVENLISPINDYINENYVEVKFSIVGEIHELQIAELLEKQEKTFGNYLREFIKQKNFSEIEVYKKSHLDRRVFYKLRNDKNYNPSKKTILAIAFGMNLNFEEALKLLQVGGYALSEYSKFDLIIKYFLENKIYDLFLINEVLDYYEFKPLGG